MLFDIQGKRRRVVQVTYLSLAILMGGGLVFFGIGGDVSGGLFDAFSDRDSGSGNQIIEDRVERSEERLKSNPRDAAALADLARDSYALAASGSVDAQGKIAPSGRGDLERADRAYQRFLALDRPADPDLASTAIQLYGPTGLDRPGDALVAAEVIAEDESSPEAYLSVVQYAVLAKDDRRADLAGQKAISLAPKAQRKAVRAQVAQAKMPPAPAGAAQGGGAGGVTVQPPGGGAPQNVPVVPEGGGGAGGGGAPSGGGGGATGGG